jgi:uroporphyrinogen decarboxylase
MNKIERVRATLAGTPVDHAPFTIWYHFGSQHAAADLTARVHLDFFQHYDVDLLKVMNDYDYPAPSGLDTMTTAADLARLEPFDPEKTPLGQQLRVVETIARALKGQALFLDTVFNAWNTVRRNLVKESIKDLMVREPEALERALGVVNDNLVRYARASLERGSAGIYLSVPATAEDLTLAQYERFMRPFDLAFLKGIADRGECHVVHAHGSKLFIDRLVDYPAHVLSWADLNGGPTIAQVRKTTDRTLMAGIDHVQFPYVSAQAIREQVAAARTAGGNTRFILAPGCSVPTYSYPPLIHAAVKAAQA